MRTIHPSTIGGVGGDDTLGAPPGGGLGATPRREKYHVKVNAPEGNFDSELSQVVWVLERVFG